MLNTNLKLRKLISVILCLSLIITTVLISTGTASAQNLPGISYSFNGEDADTPGYAQGNLTYTAQQAGTYYLYWADESGQVLDGYYEITSMSLAENESGTFEFGYHTAIPADAKKIIAVKSTSTPNEVTNSSNVPDNFIYAKQIIEYIG